MTDHSAPTTIEEIHDRVEAASKAPLTAAETADVTALHRLYDTRSGYVAVHAFGILVDARLSGKPNPSSVLLVGFASNNVVRRMMSSLEQLGFIESDEGTWRVTERGLTAHFNYHGGFIG